MTPLCMTKPQEPQPRLFNVVRFWLMLLWSYILCTRKIISRSQRTGILLQCFLFAMCTEDDANQRPDRRVSRHCKGQEAGQCFLTFLLLVAYIQGFQEKAEISCGPFELWFITGERGLKPQYRMFFPGNAIPCRLSLLERHS